MIRGSFTDEASCLRLTLTGQDHTQEPGAHVTGPASEDPLLVLQETPPEPRLGRARTRLPCTCVCACTGSPVGPAHIPQTPRQPCNDEQTRSCGGGRPTRPRTSRVNTVTPAWIRKERPPAELPHRLTPRQAEWETGAGWWKLAGAVHPPRARPTAASLEMMSCPAPAIAVSAPQTVGDGGVQLSAAQRRRTLLVGQGLKQTPQG